jgi:Na+-driven multidrug efflux pump
VSDTVVDHAYHFIIINTAMSVFIAPLVVYKSVLQAVGRTTWSMVSGFTEIIGRAGLSAAVMALIAVGTVGEDIGYIIMCFASPLAWIFGLLTILLDYIFMARKFRRMAGELSENSEISQ